MSFGQRGTCLGVALLTALLVVGMAMAACRPGLLLPEDPRSGLRRAALLAAEAGLRHALARLASDPGWKALGPAEPTREPGVSVREERGRVQGLLLSSQGGTARFEIRFAPPAEQPQADPIPLELLSRNDLLGKGPGPSGRATACLVIVARAGEDPKPEHRVLRAWIRLVGSPQADSASLKGFADWEGQFPMTGNHPETTRRRTLEDLDPGSLRTSGWPLGLQAGPFEEFGEKAPAEPGVRGEEGLPLQGGVYVWRVDSAGPYLEYFDRDPEEESLPPAGEGLRLGSWSGAPAGGGFELDPAELSLTLSRSFEVRPSGKGFKGVAFRTDPLLFGMGGLPGLRFRPPSSGVESPVLFSEGSIHVEGTVLGSGALFSLGNLRLMAPSILDSRPGSGVGLEARGDITIEPLPLEVAEARQDFAHFVAARVLAHQPLPTMAEYRQARQVQRWEEVPALDGLAAFVFQPVWDSDPGLVQAKTDQFRRVLARFGGLNYSDLCLEARIRAGGAFNADLGGRGVLHLEGALLTHAGGADRAAATRSSPPHRRAVLRLERTVWSGRTESPAGKVAGSRKGIGSP